MNELQSHIAYVNKTFIQFDTFDKNTKSDLDPDGDKINYSCHFDLSNDRRQLFAF